MLQARPRFILVAYAMILSALAGANIEINFLVKGRTWDLYPPAQAFWVEWSIVVVIVLALWNILLLRVPIGVGPGSLLVWGGMHHSLAAGRIGRT